MFLKSNSQVKWNGKISKPIKNRYGVMQGDVLSPKLFNELLQDLGKYLNPKYRLKIGDIYLVYLLFDEGIVIRPWAISTLCAPPPPPQLTHINFFLNLDMSKT